MSYSPILVVENGDMTNKALKKDYPIKRGIIQFPHFNWRVL
jgi:hypothetical protein